MAENKETKKLEKTESEKVTGGVTKEKRPNFPHTHLLKYGGPVPKDPIIRPAMAYGLPDPQIRPGFRPKPLQAKDTKEETEK